MTGVTPGQAERERFAAKMEMLAGWFDADDFAKGRAGRTEVQEDLRRWAAAARDLAAQEPHAAAPAQAAYEAFQRIFPNEDWGPWDKLDDDDRGGWFDIASATLAAAAPEQRAKFNDLMNDLRERMEAAEAAKRQAKGDLAGLEDRLAQAIAAAIMAERARIRELADRTGAVCTGDEGTSHYFSALLTEDHDA